MKLSIEQYGVEYSISNLPDDLDIYEMAQNLRQMLLCIGFHKDSIDEILEAQ